jgi:hypothetical protein
VSAEAGLVLGCRGVVRVALVIEHSFETVD